MPAPISAQRLVYDVTITRTPVLGEGGRAPELPSTTEAEIVVLLADDWHSHRRGPAEHIVDASGERAHRIDHDRGTIDTQALHADVAFREMEVANRLMLLGVIEAGGGQSPGTRADVEASLGIEAPPPAQPEPSRSPVHRNCWTIGSQEVARHEASEHAVSARALRRWLAHEVIGHPRVADEIAREGRAPARMTHRVRLIPEVEERTWVLRSADQVEVDREPGRLDLEPAPVTDELHARVRAMLDSPPPAPPSRLEQGRAALAEGRHLEALLWVFAHTLASADDCSQDMQELQQQLDERSLAYGLTLAISTPIDDEIAPQVLELYDMVEREAGPMGHLVGVFRSVAMVSLASQQEGAQRRAELLGRARQGFERALEVDPGLAGVYKDLGDLHIGSYRMDVAWDMWELARRLAPGHSLLGDVDAYEQHLRNAHPEFY